MFTEKERGIEFSKVIKSYTAALSRNLPACIENFQGDDGLAALNKLLNDNPKLNRDEKKLLIAAAIKLYSALDDKAQINIMMSASAKAMESPESEKYAEVARYHNRYLAGLYDKKEDFELRFIKAINSDNQVKALNELGVEVSGISQKLTFNPTKDNDKVNASLDYKTFYDLSRYMMRGGNWEDERDLEFEDEYEFEEEELSNYELVNMYIKQYYQICEVEAKIAGNNQVMNICKSNLEKSLENQLGKDNMLRIGITLGELDRDNRASKEHKTLEKEKPNEPFFQKQRESEVLKRKEELSLEKHK